MSHTVSPDHPVLPAPFEWALAALPASGTEGTTSDGASVQALVRALRVQGLVQSAQFLAMGNGDHTVRSGAQAVVDERLCQALRKLAAAGDASRWAIPSVSTDTDGTPRFFVVSADARALAEALEVEYGPAGVDTELRLFLGEALAAGDCFVDAAPGFGFACLTAATMGLPVGVLALAEQDGTASGIAASAAISGCADSMEVAALQPLDGLPLPVLSQTAYLIVHAGSASNVADLLAGARQTTRSGLIGAVAWSRREGDVDTAAAVLSVLGFQHFVLAEDDAGMQLVPAEATTAGGLVLSLSSEFMDRAERAEPLLVSGDAVQQAATALFDAVQEELAPGARTLGGTPSKGELATAQLEMAWSAATVVSFDIFDTLVVRKVAAPDDVFLHLAAHAPFRTCGLRAAELAQHRMEAEEEARRRGYAARGSTEVTLHEVHAVLAERVGLTATGVDGMVSAEQAVELALCTAHPVGAEWFARALQDGKRRWCLSDTCHDVPFLRRLLASCGYDVNGLLLFSSAEARVNKSEGGLFQHALRETETSPTAVLHIGDHPVGDERVPLAMGIPAVLHPWAIHRSGERPSETAGDALALGVALIGARAHEPPSPFWYRFGYSVAGPLLGGFALWLRDRFARDGIDRAYFLLRDGELLHAVYDVVCGLSAAGPHTALLESSRRAFVVPAYDAGWGTLRAQIGATENPRPAREFLERFGVDISSLGAALQAAGFTSGDDVVHPDDRAALSRVATLLRHPEVDARLRERSGSERALLMAYLEQEGVLSGGRVALVDIGWNATIQKSLMAAVHAEQRSAVVHGYYLGTLGAAHVDLGGSAVAGYLFEAGRPLDRRQALMALPQLIEFVCSTSRGSLRGFTRADDRVVPVHGSADHDMAQQEAQAQLRAGVLAYAAAFAQDAALLSVDTVSPDAALGRFARVVTAPTAEEAAHIGAVTHGEGMATARTRALAAFSPDAWTVDAIHRDVMQAYWPAGLAARHAPQALILRTLQWLSQGERE